MITQTSDVAAGTVQGRGLFSDEPTLAEYRSHRFMFYPAPFWGPVIAGTLFAFSTFVLSWYLMIACSVGVGVNHLISLGWGAAVWMWVTSIVAFYVGGTIASMISAPRGFGFLKGAAIWGLSIPLGLLAYSMAIGNGVLGLINLPHPGMMATGAGLGISVHYDFMWAAFITLALGLLAAMAGSATGRPYMAGTESLAGTATTPAVTP